MQTSVSLSLQRHNLDHGSGRGFTLLEMITVLFIIGLSASLVIPNLPLVFDRIAFALERETVIRTLNTLPYQAFKQNQDLVLKGEHGLKNFASEDPQENEVIDTDDLQLAAPFRSASLRVVSISLPEDWYVSVPEPIIYRSSGFCTGGRVIIELGQAQYALSARAPYCQFSEEDQ